MISNETPSHNAQALEAALAQADEKKRALDAEKKFIQEHAEKTDGLLQELADKLNDFFSQHKLERLHAETGVSMRREYPAIFSDFKEWWDNEKQQSKSEIGLGYISVMDKGEHNLGVLWKKQFLTHCRTFSMTDEIFEKNRTNIEGYMFPENIDVSDVITEITLALKG